jgi:hypothetical protein
LRGGGCGGARVERINILNKKKVRGVSINDFFSKFIISVSGCHFDYAARAQRKPCCASVYKPMK